MPLRRCTACNQLHELGFACPVKAERDRERWAEQSRRRGKRPYDTARWQKVAQAAKVRDGFRCRASGCNETRGLNAHHLHPDPDRFFDLANVVTLSASHHRLAEFERRNGPGGRGTVERKPAPDHASRSAREISGQNPDEQVLVA